MTPAEKNAFNEKWLKAWSDKDVEAVSAMYATDCTYWDSGCKGLTGRAALAGYLAQIFPMVPAWNYQPDAFWPTDEGFCARWYCDMGDVRLRGFDFVQLRDGLIAHNEVYTHPV